MNNDAWICDAKKHFTEIGEEMEYQVGDDNSEESKEIKNRLQKWIKSQLTNQENVTLHLKGSKWNIQGHKKLNTGLWYRISHKDFGDKYPVVLGVSLGKEGLNIHIQLYDNLVPDETLRKMLGEKIKDAVKDKGLGSPKDGSSYFGYFDVKQEHIDEQFKKVLGIYQALPAKINNAIFKKMIELYQKAPESYHCQIANNNERYSKRLKVKGLVDNFIAAEANSDELEKLFREFWNREIINCVQQGASAGNVIERNGGIENLQDKIANLIKFDSDEKSLLKEIQGCVSSSKNSSLELYYLYHMQEDNFPLINGGIRNAIEVIKKNKVNVEGGEEILQVMESLKNRMMMESELSKYYLLDQFLNLIDKIKYEDIEKAGESEELYQWAYLFTFFRKVHQVNNAGFFDELLMKSKNIILYGAPGTGKTYTSRENIQRIIESDFPNEDIDLNDRFQILQFHPSYSYEDFMEGLKPVMKNGNIALELKQGDFLHFCERANEYADRFNMAKEKEKMKYAFFFLIDEINRAELSRVFGELMYALDKRGQGIQTQYSYLKEENKKFIIPENVYLIGTMNDVDKSIDSFDLALRRRFFWYRMDCDYGVIQSELTKFDNIGTFNNKDVPHSGYLKSCYDLNQYITQRNNDSLGLGKLYELGHSYFISIKAHAKKDKITNNNLKDLFEFSISPLLKEYLRSGYSEEDVEDKLKEAKKKFVLPND